MLKFKAIKLAMNLGIAFNWTSCTNYTNKDIKAISEKLLGHYHNSVCVNLENMINTGE
jgi:hypothetical protein